MSLANGRPYLAIPGPSVMPDRVLAAMQRPAPNIYTGALHEMTATLIPDLKRVAGTAHHAAIYIANGHGMWEAALLNVLARGDWVLALGPAPALDNDRAKLVADKLAATLDGKGAGNVTLSKLPEVSTPRQLLVQATGVVIVAAWVLGTSAILFKVLKSTVGLRVSAEEELAGLDVAEHGSPGYGPEPVLAG